MIVRLLILLLFAIHITALEPIPDKLVVLTFDDSVASHHAIVRPILKRHNFGATFFITEGFSFATNKADYMTWNQIAELHSDGFEIGNHTRDHMAVTPENLPKLREQVETLNAHLAEHGIPKPTTFAWPGNALTPEALPILRELGIRFARRGGAPEFPYDQGRGFAFEPGLDHPLLIPSAGDARPNWGLEDFKRAVNQARGGRIAVLQFHGVPDRDHPWVHTPPERFTEYMQYLAAENFRVIALRGLARYVDPEKLPAEPNAIIEKRKASLRPPAALRVMTYNIHHGEGLDGKVDLERIARLINDNKADLVALQEVDRNTGRTQRRDMPAELAKLTGMQQAFGGNLPLEGGDYGNAILSRFPILSVANHHLPKIVPGEQRGILETKVQVGERDITFCSIHLDHRRPEEDRLASVAKVRELLSSRRPLIVAGDFNAIPASETYARTKAFLKDAWRPEDGEGLTIPANKPTARIDYIWVSQDFTSHGGSIPQSEASDHLPVLIELKLSDQNP